MQGEWSPPSDAALVAVWDNSYSYLREKTVAFSARVKKPGMEPPPPPAAAAAEPEPAVGAAAEPSAAATRDSVLARMQALKEAKKATVAVPEAVVEGGAPVEAEAPPAEAASEEPAAALAAVPAAVPADEPIPELAAAAE